MLHLLVSLNLLAVSCGLLLALQRDTLAHLVKAVFQGGDRLSDLVEHVSDFTG